MTVLKVKDTAAPDNLHNALHEFSAHIRNPTVNSAPEGIEDRRMGIYRDLFYNNIEGFISSAFPVLRSISSDEYWDYLVRGFIVQHRAKTPYFAEIAKEFLMYLECSPSVVDNPEGFPFLLELAHYEWVELALDTCESDDLCVKAWPDERVESCRFTVSPLACSLSYNYPVHLVGPGFIPDKAGEQVTQLLVYRNSDDIVGFMEINAVSACLLQMIQENPDVPLLESLAVLAGRLSIVYNESFVNHAIDLLRQLHGLDIILLD